MRKKKVLAYIVQDSQLLVFRHTQHPEAGIQVPGGTLETGETLAEAVLREAHEETGLVGLQVVDYLGSHEHVMTPFRQEVQERHFFWLKCTTAPPLSWVHIEIQSDTGRETFEFEFFWLPLDGSDLGLAANQGKLLANLERSVPLQKRPKTEIRRYGFAEINGHIRRYRLERFRKIEKCVAKLFPGDTIDLGVGGTNAAAYAVLQHNFYALVQAARVKDYSIADSVARVWREGWLREILTSTPYLVIQRSLCAKIVDSNFESPVYLFPLVEPPKLEDNRIDLFSKALRLVERSGFSATVNGVFGLVILLDYKSPEEATNSYTLSGFPGTIYADWVSDAARLGEIILHESTHNWLNDAFASLGENLLSDNKWWSPWRKMNRQAHGIVQAAFVFSQLVQYFSAILDIDEISEYARAYAMSRLKVEAQVLREVPFKTWDALSHVKDPLLRGLISDEINRAVQIAN